MRHSLSRLFLLPPSQPHLSRARPPLSDPETTRLWYTKYRPWLLTISVGIVVAGGALFGAELKTDWQRRKVRELRALEQAAEVPSAGRVGIAEGGRSVLQNVEGSVLQNDAGEVKDGVPATLTPQGSKGKESQPPSQAQIQVLTEKEVQTRNKKIHDYIENLEARKKELLMKKEEIAVKVLRLRQRMKRKEEEQRDRERVGREGGARSAKIER